ncbi:MauE/DoxX family redox-associated membrane protein [Actinomadura parmotrematis]|uniref:Methylamine utilisation protein MauE domain-containing protein n=1 Tax=Actinomadura parmotrematis TaxID=2864039 RepID=A0ABS7FYD4_9ACTN|nr:MauE/DoxX family redox-associated membrane protein [Actinomadura parmotrematis]MBW8485449.1 hypothetical protein [Actinomadura parmotrematis]
MDALAAGGPATAAVLAAAALAKARDVPGFAAAIGGYRIVPARWTRACAAATLATEAAAAVLLVPPGTRRWGALAAAGLFAVFLAAMASVLARGLRVDCGCFGGRALVGPLSIARTGLLLALAVAAVVAGPAPLPAGTLALSAGYLLVIGALSLPPGRGGEASGPGPGGRFVLAGGAASDGPTLYALVSPGCGLCTAMLPEFAGAASRLRVVAVSGDDAGAVRAHLAEHGAAGLPVVHDPDVYDANGIPWPPYAVVTDAAGTVLAAGGADRPEALAALLERAAVTRRAGGRRPR